MRALRRLAANFEYLATPAVCLVMVGASVWLSADQLSVRPFALLFFVAALAELGLWGLRRHDEGRLRQQREVAELLLANIQKGAKR